VGEGEWESRGGGGRGRGRSRGNNFGPNDETQATFIVIWFGSFVSFVGSDRWHT